MLRGTLMLKKRLSQVSSTVKQILTKRSVVLDVVLLSAISLISISWFRGNFLIWSKGFLWPANWHDAVYTWYDKFSMGYVNPRGAALLPYYLFQLITDTLGFTPVASEKFFFFLVFLSAGLSMYYLTWVLKLPRLARLAAALFYMMNPININFLHLSAYSLTPFILGAFIWGLREKRGLGFIIAFVCIWTLTTSYVYNHPSAFLIHWGILITYLVYYCAVVARSRPQVLSALRFTGLLIVIFLFLNLFWIIVMVSTVPTAIGQTQLGAASNLDIFKWLSADLLDAVRLLGYGQGLASTFGGDPIFPWASSYLKSPPLIIMEILIPIIACLFVFSGDRRRKVGLFFFLALLPMAIFLQKGARGFLGNFNLWIFERIPYLIDIFRNPQRFGSLVAFSYAPLLGMGLYLIYDFVVKRFRRVWLNVCLLLIFSSFFVFYSLPFWTGELFHSGGQVIPSERIQIPDYYPLARKWLHREGEEMARIYPLPFPRGYHMVFKWEHGYAEMNPDAYLLDTSVIAYNDNSSGYKVPLLIGQKIKEGYDGDLASLLSLLQVKYLLFHRDAYWEYLKLQPGSFFGENEEEIESFLDGQENIHFQRSFGLLDFYKISDEYSLPYIYPSITPTLVSGDVEAITSLTETKYLDGKPALFFNSQIENKGLEKRKDISKLVFSHNRWRLLDRDKGISSREPEITFQKINPTKYLIRVEKAKDSFWLIFSESFHRQWRAYIRQVRGSEFGVQSGKDKFEWSALVSAWKDRGKRVELKEHYMVNGYANAWYVPVSQFPPKADQPQAEASSPVNQLGNKLEQRAESGEQRVKKETLSSELRAPSSKQRATSEMEIVIEYMPQRIFEVGVLISGLTLLGCVGYLVGTGVKRKKRRV